MAAMDDAALMGRLAAIAGRLDAPPPEAYQLGRDAFALHLLDVELAELIADSFADAQLVRAPSSDVRLLTFEAIDLAIELQCAPSGVLGQLLPEAARQVRLQTVDAVTTTTADQDGRFSFPDPPDGLVRFVVGRVATPWLRL